MVGEILPPDSGVERRASRDVSADRQAEQKAASMTTAYSARKAARIAREPRQFRCGIFTNQTG
jgi:hypothetical protein